MKQFLHSKFKTDQIDRVDYEKLKEALDGESILPRIKYKIQVGEQITGKKQIVKKKEILKKQHKMASSVDEDKKNSDFGFVCLHYSVSEGSGSIQIVI